MSLSDPPRDEVVTRLYRASELLDDPGLRELLKNAAVALLRAETFKTRQHTLTLIDSLLVTASALGVMPAAIVESLREPLPGLLGPRELARVDAH